MYIEGINTVWVQKIKKSKICNILKDSELYKVFMYNILCQTADIFIVHILLTRRIILLGYTTFLIFSMLNCVNFSIIHTTQATYYLSNPILCHYRTPNHLFLTQNILLALK